MNSPVVGMGIVTEAWADPSYAKKILGWESKYDLIDMLKDAWRWQSKYPNVIARIYSDKLKSRGFKPFLLKI